MPRFKDRYWSTRATHRKDSTRPCTQCAYTLLPSSPPPLPQEKLKRYEDNTLGARAQKRGTRYEVINKPSKLWHKARQGRKSRRCSLVVATSLVDVIYDVIHRVTARRLVRFRVIHLRFYHTNISRELWQLIVRPRPRPRPRLRRDIVFMVQLDKPPRFVCLVGRSSFMNENQIATRTYLTLYIYKLWI